MRSTLDALFDRTNHLNGLLHHLETQLRYFRQSVEEGNRNRIEDFAAGSSLVIRDLTEWPAHGWAVVYPSGAFGTSGQEFIDQVDVLVSREAAWAIGQAFEAFETCVKDLLAAYLRGTPSAADAAKYQRAEQALKKSGLTLGTEDLWKAYVRREYRNADAALAEIRRIAPHLDDAEQRNNYERDLRSWFSAVSEVRHATVHSNLTIVASRWARLSADRQRLAEANFSGVHDSVGYHLQPTVKQATAAITGLVEYGYAVFKALSVAGQTEWRVFPRQGMQ